MMYIGKGQAWIMLSELPNLLDQFFFIPPFPRCGATARRYILVRKSDFSIDNKDKGENSCISSSLTLYMFCHYSEIHRVNIAISNNSESNLESVLVLQA